MIVTFLEAMGYIKREFKGIVTVMIVVIFCTACGTECLEHQPSATGEESKEQSVNLTEEDALLTELQAKQIIEEADNALQTVMKKADVYNENLPDEEEVRAYLSDYFDPDILDYVFYVYQIQVEDGKCFYEYYSHYSNFYLDPQEDIQMAEQGEGYCELLVSFVHRWNRVLDEDKVTVRVEQKTGGRWVITRMNHWYNDFRYYYMPKMDYWPEYMTEDMAAWMVREFGTDENGEKIQLCVSTGEEGFILPDSSERKIDEQEIASLSRYEKFLAVQEIYARKGKKFDDVMLYGYFHTKPWYDPYQQVFDEDNLTEMERYNIEQLTASGSLGELARPDYGNRYREEMRVEGQPLNGEEAVCIIEEAFAELDRTFTAKAENLIAEMSDDVETYYSLGEYSAEPQLRAYVSTWFSDEMFDYLMAMCIVMHGLTKDENDQYVLERGLTSPIDVYVLDDFSSVQIKDFNETACTVTVGFWNLYGFPGDSEMTSEGEILLRKEGGRWIIADISEPHYDEYYAFLQGEYSEDNEAVMGSNLCYGSSMAEGDGAVYTLDIGMYGGKPMGEDECYNIYRQREGEWEVYISHPSYTADVNSISNVVYLDGYIYYVLKEVEVGGETTKEDAHIFRFAKEDGYEFPDLLLSCDKDYYIYEDEIYFQYHEKGIRYFYKANLDGEDVKELYSDKQESQTDADYTVGGGCLYLKEGEQILEINLESGERRRFTTDAQHIGGMFYEKGRLYLYDSKKKEVYQMDVRIGDELKLIGGKILEDCVWIHDGYLYYVEGEKTAQGYNCDLKAMNLNTREVLVWQTVTFDAKPCDAGLEVVEGRAIADFYLKREDGTEEYRYIEKEIREIMYKGNKKGTGKPDEGKEEDGERRIVIQKGMQEAIWQVQEEDETAIGYNVRSYALSAEGDGCIYSTDMGMYGGKSPEEEGGADIYRLKEGRWELFVSHPAAEEDPWWVETSVYNLTYYNGCLYYILLRDYDPGSGAGNDYSICRIAEQNGVIEELAKCNGNFFIYQDEIYYDDIGKKGRRYFKMKPDGKDKELLYFDDGTEYHQFTYAVGGDCLYLWSEGKIAAVHIVNDKQKILTYFDVPVESECSIFYEDGKLYLFDIQYPIVYQMDVRTGEVNKVLEILPDYQCKNPLDYQYMRLSDYQRRQYFAVFFNCHVWVDKGYLYYINWERMEEGDAYEFKVMNLSTGEITTWDSVYVKNESVLSTPIHLEVTGDCVMVRLGVEGKNEAYEYRYLQL